MQLPADWKVADFRDRAFGRELRPTRTSFSSFSSDMISRLNHKCITTRAPAQMSEGQRTGDAEVVLARVGTTPEDRDSSSKKRKRKVLSCWDCRRRKLQCDRGMPACERCAKAGKASYCTYLDDPIETPARTTKQPRSTFDSTTGVTRDDQITTNTVQPSQDLFSRTKYQGRRIQQLEAALARTSHSAEDVTRLRLGASNIPPTPESVQGKDLVANVNDRETMLLRGKSFETQFSGTTHPLALIAHIPELNLFTKEALEMHPSFQHVKQDMGALEARIKCADRHYTNIANNRLHTLLPSKAEADQAVQNYLDSYDRIYHIIHEPSFWGAYSAIWQVGLENASRHTLAMVLLMISSVSCHNPAQPWVYITNSSKARETAIVATQACEAWINKQSQKRVTAADFQIRFLLCLTKQTTARKYKRTWTEIGTLLRFCMSAGLHRSPELIRRPTTAVDKELRCRIWAAVLDFELQASFDRGMMSAPWMLQSDTSGPINVHDNDIVSENMPTSRPGTDFTKSWYLSRANDSMMLRSNLNGVLNNIRHNITFQEVKQYTDEIECQIRSIPQLTFDNEEAHSLLKLKLLQYQLAVHNKFLRSSYTDSERTFSMMTILETVSTIVGLHQSLTTKEKRSLQFLGYDLLRSALSMANVVSVQTVPSRGLLTSVIFQNVSLIEQVTNMLADKAARLGCEQRQLWVALAAHGFAKSKKDPGSRPQYMKEAVDVITQVYYKMMACQESGHAPVSTTEASYEQQNSKGIVDYLPIVPGEPDATSQRIDSADAAQFNLDDFAAWTFEDWMFDPNDVSIAFDTS